MKRILVAAGVALVSLSAFSQSSVTLFGIVDVGVGRVGATGAGHTNGMLAGNVPSRLGFRGTEDLGGGLAASFWLEGELMADTGNANGFNFLRRSTVSLSGPFGEVRAGRDFAMSYLNNISFDSTGQRGFDSIEFFGPTVGSMTSAGAAFSYVRNSNAIAYFLPASLGGVYGGAQYALGENNSNTATTATTSKKQGNYAGGRLGYAAGKLDIAVGQGVYYGVSRATTYTDDYKVTNFGASYDFGVIKPLLFIQNESMDGRGALAKFDLNTYVLGFTAPVGSGTLRASYHRYENKTTSALNSGATKIGASYTYYLSKRTGLYAEVARLKNQNVALPLGGIGAQIPGGNISTPGGRATGYAVGIRHSF
ncbi:MAG: porin [Pseudomonadota bacterium]